MMLKLNLVQFLQQSWSLLLVIGVLPGIECLVPQSLLSLIRQVNLLITVNILLDYLEPPMYFSMIMSLPMIMSSTVKLDLVEILNLPTYINLGISNNFTWIQLAQLSSIALLLMQKHWDLKSGLNLVTDGMRDFAALTTRPAVNFTSAINVQNLGIDHLIVINYDAYILMPMLSKNFFQSLSTPSSYAGGYKNDWNFTWLSPTC